MKKILGISIWLLVVTLIALGISAISHLSFLWTVLIVAGAILLNGWIATLEDDLPGGFNNPDGTNTPKYAVITGWIVRGVGVAILIFGIVIISLTLFSPN